MIFLNFNLIKLKKIKLDSKEIFNRNNNILILLNLNVINNNMINNIKINCKSKLNNLKISINPNSKNKKNSYSSYRTSFH
jgi:hypothetical protein